MSDHKSQISETDVELFHKLMSRENLSLNESQLESVFDKIKKNPRQGIHIEVIESPKITPPQKPAISNIPQHKPEDKKVGTPIEKISQKEFSKKIQQEQNEQEDENEGDDETEEEDNETDSDENEEEPQGIFSKTVQAKTADLKNGATSETPYYQETSYIPPNEYLSPEADVEEENKNPSIRHEKQQILFLFKKKYPSEHTNFNIKMPLYELKYEYQQREDHQAEIEKLEFMKELLRIVLHGIEMANDHFGPIFMLKGWAASLTDDMTKFDRCLTGIYLQFFKKKKMSPIAELLWIIIGSLALWHMKSKMGENPAQKSREKQVFSNIGQGKPANAPRNQFDKPGGMPNLASLLSMFG